LLFGEKAAFRQPFSKFFSRSAGALLRKTLPKSPSKRIPFGMPPFEGAKLLRIAFLKKNHEPWSNFAQANKL